MRQAAIVERSAAEFGIEPDDIVVGTVANFRPQKDYPNLLAAVRLLADREVPVRFVAVGQGPHEADTRQLATELELGDRLIFAGFRDDAVRVMGACDVFTMASQWEGLPVALMEALALGLPVVATNVGGIAEAMVDGETAVLVPPGDSAALADAIERVAADPNLQARLAAASERKAHDFDIRRAIAPIEAAYAQLAPAAALVPAEPPPPIARRPVPQGLNIREATPADRQAILELCRSSLGWSDDPRFDELFSWKHDQNAFGPSYMWVATDGNKVVGLRAFMRWEFVRGGEILRAVRAVDTATHPDYQGKGLFTAMTLHGLDIVKDDGIDFVFNTPNDKSRPGYLKMGWQEAGRLLVAVRITRPTAALSMARSRVAASHWPITTDVGIDLSAALVGGATLDQAPSGRPLDVREIATSSTKEFRAWRYGSELLGCRATPVGDGHLVFRLRQRGRSRELVVLDMAGVSDREANAAIVGLLAATECDHALRLGDSAARHGWLSAPIGPILAWRAVEPSALPQLRNWRLQMADIELL